MKLHRPWKAKPDKEGARGLPCTRPITVQVAHMELVPWVRGRLRAALHWLLKRVRIQLVRPQLWSDLWSAQKSARTTTARSPVAIRHEGPAHCVRQSWCVAKRQNPVFLLQASRKQRGVRMPMCSTKPVESGPVKAWKQRWKDTQHRYDAYTEAFNIPSGYFWKYQMISAKSMHGSFPAPSMHVL